MLEVDEGRPGTLAISGRWQGQEGISWLIVGDTRALLFDTGNGIADIRRVVDRLTGLPLTVTNSHSHADHVGGNHAFVEILSTMDDFAIARSQGLPYEAVSDAGSPQVHNLERKAWITTGVAFVLWVIIAGVIISGWISLDDMNFFDRALPTL